MFSPGDYFARVEEFDRVHKKIQIKAIQNVLALAAGECNWKEDAFVRQALDDALAILR